MKTADLDSIAAGIVEALPELVATEVASLREALVSLERIVVGLQLEVRELSSRPPGLVYRGIWENDVKYLMHESVTDEGALWICLKSHSGRKPKTAVPEFWRCGVRAGRPGKDGKDCGCQTHDSKSSK